ncbi:hypothetical protein FEE95_16640 [Maribacter algarum]|uniref:DUF4350 domain-containing protein n=1 Tax=Maribacter algarum (ex Zhang et al. 2020) TaxID=2578118 RepID=A0A5S3PRH0_9FLAO|nr:hypothetical protein [Maribacter algarum]TMM56245.1 hypothetical protein FEE95_16640 [Maribacter algarum]
MNRKGILVSSFVILMIVLVFANRSHTVNWTPTFNEFETKPMDTKVFFDQLPFWFQGKSVKKIHTTFYEYDQYLRDQPVDSTKNYISISKHYDIDNTSFEALLEYVAYGNDAFISAYSFPYYVKDTLGFKTAFENTDITETENTLFFEFAKDSLVYTSKIPTGTSYVKDSTAGKKLGYFISDKGKKRTNFVGIPYYDGIFYIHTAPEVFTNYQMLEASDTRYVSTAISYMPQVPFLLDKAVKTNPEISDSTLRYIMSKEPLKWSWYLLLLALALFIFFNAKRRQRIIPIIEPLKNTTTEFVHTVSNLHYEAADYNGIIQKKIIHFLESIRSKYHLSTENLNEDFVKKLALKSGNQVEQVQQLVTLILKMKSHNFMTKEPLVKLNKEIENFYNKDKN